MMTVKDLALKLTKGTAKTAASVVHHPLGSAAMAAGLVKGTAEAGAGLVRGLVRRAPGVDLPVQREETADPASAAAGSTTDSGPREPQVVPKPVLSADELPEPIVIEADDDAQIGEAFHNEPKATSREAEHGEGPIDREELEGDLEEMDFAADEDVPVWTSETPVGGPDGDESLLDDATVNAIRSESEMLQKAAEHRAE